jgi:hypothetical protein
MIKLLCYYKGKNLGSVAVKNGALLIKSNDESFIAIVEEIFEEGILISTGDRIFPRDSKFILVLEKFLLYCGFQVIRVDTELVSKLKQKILASDKSLSESNFNEMYGNLPIYEASLLLRTLSSLSG